MPPSLRETILNANVALHAAEAALYDRIHPELTNTDERRRLARLLEGAVTGLPEKAPCTALDVGAGTGFVTSALLEWGFRVDAVDISAEMIGRLKAKNAKAMKERRLALAIEDVDSFLATTKKRYAVITASSVLHHLPDYAETIRTLVDRLVPGGALVLFHEPTGGDVSRAEMFLRRVDWKLARMFFLSGEEREMLQNANLSYEMADYHETHGFDEDKVRAVLKKSGLVVTHRERYATAQTGIVRWIFAVFFPSRTWSVLARKPRG